MTGIRKDMWHVMSKKVKIKLNSAGVKELLKSAPIVDACEEQAQMIRNRAGEGFEVQKRTYPERTGAAVVAATSEARKKNLKENTLLKAIGK